MDSQISNYREALSWLFSQLPMFSRIGAPAYKPGLQTTEALDRLYGHPHRRFKAIHVGGTNGKGSTSHLLAAALQAQGYKTALYTSPHLTDFRERMRIDGKMIPREDVARFVEDWKTRNTPLTPSFFELTMMMAFDWFAREEVNYAVIEVGMGGRLDSTNVITPVLSVITSISLDHTQFLGNTRPAIAREKAGIIKPGIPVVVGEADDEVKNEFLSKAASEGAPIYFAEDYGEIHKMERTAGGWEIYFQDPELPPITVPLGGEYQKKNIRTALKAIDVMRQMGIKISEKALRSGFENISELTGLRGRWQIVSESPCVICDTGHNEAGLTETMKSLKARYPDKRIHFILGFVNDKDVVHIVDLFPSEGIYYFTRASIPRAMSEEKVASIFAERGIKGEKYPSVGNAYERALRKASPEDVVFVGGSTFVVADLLEYLEHH